MLRWILFPIIGIVAGWLASKFMKSGGFGLIGNLVVGVVGAIIGGWLFSLLGIEVGGIIGSLITALVGAVVLLFVISLIKKK